MAAARTRDGDMRRVVREEKEEREGNRRRMGTWPSDETSEDGVGCSARGEDLGRGGVDLVGGVTLLAHLPYPFIPPPSSQGRRGIAGGEAPGRRPW